MEAVQSLLVHLPLRLTQSLWLTSENGSIGSVRVSHRTPVTLKVSPLGGRAVRAWSTEACVPVPRVGVPGTLTLIDRVVT